MDIYNYRGQKYKEIQLNDFDVIFMAIKIKQKTILFICRKNKIFTILQKEFYIL